MKVVTEEYYYEASVADERIVYTSNDTAHMLRLPPLADFADGVGVFPIINQGTASITLRPAGSDLIDCGHASVKLSDPYRATLAIAGRGSWFLIK